jgi:putative membrane protein
VDALEAMFTDRPYVLAFFASFLVVASAERGWKRTLFWLASGTFLGWLAEFSSIRNGFPFGFYTYHHQNFPAELWLGGVPFFASISFAFLTYFGYSIATTFLSPLRRVGSDIRREDDPRVANSVRVLALAALVTTWLDTVTDPVTHLGRYWFLGDLYVYHVEGVHFHVPLSNYAGWIVSSLAIVFANQRFDAWLSRREAHAPRGFHLPFKPFWALGSAVGNLAFINGIAVMLLVTDAVPDGVPIGQVLASGLFISILFIAFSAARIRSGLQTKSPSHA